MAVKLSKQARRFGVMALAISALALPSMASAEPEDGGRDDRRAQSEDGSRQARVEQRQEARQERQEQAQEAPAQRAEPQSQPANWGGGGGRDRGADEVASRSGGNAGNAAPQATPPQQQQPVQQSGWAGGHRQGRGWTDANRADQQPTPTGSQTWSGGNHREGDHPVGSQGRTWNRDGNHDRNREGGGRNWTDADRHNHEGGDRHRHDDRQRDRTGGYVSGGYVSGGYYYGNNSGYSQNYDHRDRDDQQWNRQWRNNSNYNWYSYRSSHPSYYRLGTYYSPYRNYSYRRLSIGFFLQNLFFGQNYQIQDPRYYRLPDVYGPYRWVRYYDDAVLVDIYSGEVVDVINNFFW